MRSLLIHHIGRPFRGNILQNLFQNILLISTMIPIRTTTSTSTSTAGRGRESGFLQQLLIQGGTGTAKLLECVVMVMVVAERAGAKENKKKRI